MCRLGGSLDCFPAGRHTHGPPRQAIRQTPWARALEDSRVTLPLAPYATASPTTPPLLHSLTHPSATPPLMVCDRALLWPRRERATGAPCPSPAALRLPRRRRRRRCFRFREGPRLCNLSFCLCGGGDIQSRQGRKKTTGRSILLLIKNARGTERGTEAKREQHNSPTGQQQRRGRRADHRGCNVMDEVPQIPASPPSSRAARSSASPFMTPQTGGWQPRHLPSDTSPPPTPSASTLTAHAAVNARCPSDAPSVSPSPTIQGRAKNTAFSAAPS